MDIRHNGDPLFSVILRTYQRGGKLLGRAIRSVLAQTFTDFEVLVVDDCSPEYFVRLVQTDARGASLNRHLMRMHRQPDRLTKLTPERSRTVERILTLHQDYLNSVGLYHPFRRQFVRHLDQPAPR